MNQTITLNEIESKVNNLQRSTIKTIFQEIINSLREDEWESNYTYDYYTEDYVRTVGFNIEKDEIFFSFNHEFNSALIFHFNDESVVKLSPSDLYIYDGLVYDLSEVINRFLRSESRIVKEITNNLLTYVKGVIESWHTS